VLTQLKEKITKTREAFRSKFEDLTHSNKSREEILDELAESMILADIGIPLTERILDTIRAGSKKTDTFPIIKNLLEKEIKHILSAYSPQLHLDQPHSVLMVTGVNGGGKTTSLAKIASIYKQEGKKILLVAADTFRAAAQEQLSIWGGRLDIPVITGQYGADPASVVFDAIRSFKARNFDLLLIDTAGRIHTNVNLMHELEKIKRVISREIPGAPHECLLVLDASIGQNALVQAKQFLIFSSLTGIVLTKLDGTAKGGSVISILDECRLPIKLIGLGEGEQDLIPFSAEEFTSALLS